jgi:hypothetical protein
MIVRFKLVTAWSSRLWYHVKKSCQSYNLNCSIRFNIWFILFSNITKLFPFGSFYAAFSFSFADCWIICGLFQLFLIVFHFRFANYKVRLVDHFRVFFKENVFWYEIKCYFRLFLSVNLVLIFIQLWNNLHLHFSLLKLFWYGCFIVGFLVLGCKI